MIVRYVGNSLHLIYFLITFDFFVFIYCFFELCREALPFFFLLSDFTAVCGMAKFALQSASHVSICTCKRLVQYHSLLSFFHALLCVQLSVNFSLSFSCSLLSILLFLYLFPCAPQLPQFIECGAFGRGERGCSEKKGVYLPQTCCISLSVLKDATMSDFTPAPPQKEQGSALSFPLLCWNYILVSTYRLI